MANWTEDEIEQMVAEKREDTQATMMLLPNFENFMANDGQGAGNGNGQNQTERRLPNAL